MKETSMWVRQEVVGENMSPWWSSFFSIKLFARLDCGWNQDLKLKTYEKEGLKDNVDDELTHCCMINYWGEIKQRLRFNNLENEVLLTSKLSPKVYYPRDALLHSTLISAF